nr:hypothetical protein Iba_chr13cCG1010 [Ipomoea batatas]
MSGGKASEDEGPVWDWRMSFASSPSMLKSNRGITVESFIDKNSTCRCSDCT